MIKGDWGELLKILLILKFALTLNSKVAAKIVLYELDLNFTKEGCISTDGVIGCATSLYYVKIF